MHRPRMLLYALVVTATTWPAAAQQSAPLDLSYIPADAFAAVIVHPRRILDSPEMELMPREILQAAFQQEVGLDPTQIEQAVGVLTLAAERPEPAFGLILRFGQPLVRDQALAKQLARAPKATHSGKEYYQADLAVLFADDRTLVLAPEPVLKRMIDAAGADSPLLKMLRKADAADDAQAIVALEPLRPLINQVLANPPPLPPALGDLLQLPKLVEQVHVRVSGGVRQVSLSLTAGDAQQAGDVERILKQAIAVGKQMALVQMAQEMQRADPDDPVARATQKYAHRLIDYFAKRIEPKRDGLQVAIKSDFTFGAGQSAVLAALLLPAVQSARAAARRTQSMNNVKQLVLGIHIYENQHAKLPNSIVDKNGKPLLSWRVHLLPFLDQQALYNKFHLDEPWDSEHNKALLSQMPAVFRHPEQDPQDFRTRYLGVAGKGTFFGERDLTFAKIVDGTSNTIAVVEVAPEQAVEWTRPQDWEFNPQQPARGLLQRGAPGFLAGFADGSVRFISENVDTAALKAAFTIAGGEVEPLRP